MIMRGATSTAYLVYTIAERSSEHLFKCKLQIQWTKKIRKKKLTPWGY